MRNPATLTVLNPTDGKVGSLPLPAAGWRVNRSGTTYKYRDALMKVLLRNRRQLKIKVRNMVIDIRDDSQGTLSVRRDRPCKFVAKRATAPVVCPTVALAPDPNPS